MKIFFSPHCLEYSASGHPESPLRVSNCYQYLKQKKFDFIEPKQECPKEDILLVHSKTLLEKVKSRDFFDMDTPSLDNIFYYARLAAASAIDSALYTLKNKENSFSLMRPPGHHATKDDLGGFCYFNNIAIAVMKARDLVSRIAIVDVDCHHGNGTQDIFLGRKDIIYLSLHQSPLYPGTGLKSQANCFNFPLAYNSGPEIYLSTLKAALSKVEDFCPELIAVSLGLDTYKFDPLANLGLDITTYASMGELISALKIPVFCVLEGGYNIEDMPLCLYEFIRALV